MNLGNFNCDEGNKDLSLVTFLMNLIYTHIFTYIDIDPGYYDVKKRAKIFYSWEDAINKIDFRDTSKKDVSTQCGQCIVTFVIH